MRLSLAFEMQRPVLDDHAVIEDTLQQCILADEVGFDGVVSIEHEDRDWGSPGGPLARRQEGLREAQRVLCAAMPGTTAPAR